VMPACIRYPIMHLPPKVSSLLVYFVLLTQLVGHVGAHASVVGPMTRAQYVSRYGGPPGAGNTNGYTNRLEAQAAAAKFNANPEPAAGPAMAPSVAPTKGLTNPLSGVNAIGDFFNRLTQPNTWIRVGEVVAGLLLIYVGVNALMRDTAAGKAVQSAKRGAERTATAIGAVVPK
jgi:hypothetical protein